VQAVVALILGLVLLGIVAPFVSAASFGSGIQHALETALGRKVQIGKTHFTLFAGPGFSLDDVTISEDPRFGLEPFAHADTLDVRVRPDKLLLGRLQISSLRLEHPSLNLVKTLVGGWNVVELLSRLSAPRRMPLNLFPAVELADARIDFKLGVRKTTLYLAETDLDLFSQRSGQLGIRFAGSPARSDRAGQGFGHFRGDVAWFLAPDPSGKQLQGDVTLEPSNLSEITTLIQGYDIGIHGTVGTRIHVEGPATALNVTGELRLGDVHRWDLIPVKGEDWRIRYRGALDLLGHRFSLETLPESNEASEPVKLQVKVSDFLVQPSWTILATLHGAPAGNLLPLAQRMGLSVPEGLTLQGSLGGVVGYSNHGGLEGELSISGGNVTLPGLSPLHAESATGSLTTDHFHLYPVTIRSGPNSAIQASADFSFATRAVDVRVTSDQADIADLTKTLRAWFDEVPLLENFSSGRVAGEIHYAHTAPDPPAWSGQLQLQGATLQAAGLASPLTGLTGKLVFDDDAVDTRSFSATLDDLAVRGEYHYSTKGARHERVRVELASADLSQLEKQFEPSLRSSGILARFRPGKRSLPVWLAQRNLEADVSIGQLSVAGTPLGELKTHLLWDAANIQLTAMQLKLENTMVKAKGVINLVETRPRYRLNGSLDKLPWKGGDLGLEGRLESSGLGDDALRNLRSTGTFHGTEWALNSEVDLERLSGKYSLTLEDGWPNLNLSAIQATQGEETWDGTASSSRDGKLVFEFSNSRGQLHVVSTLSALPSEPVAADIRSRASVTTDR
jgi:hypothetical protein